MELPEIVQTARNLAVMVRIAGPDPKGLKMRRHAFHHHEFGKTTLSASGFMLPNSLIDVSFQKQLWEQRSVNFSDSILVVTTASVVEPFLPVRYRYSLNEQSPKLIPGAHIDILTECDSKAEDALLGAESRKKPTWVSAELLALVDVPSSNSALQSMLQAHGVPHDHGSWDMGWSLAPLNGDKNGQSTMDAVRTQVGTETRTWSENQRHQALDEQSNLGIMAVSTTRIALLGVSTLSSKGLPQINVSSPAKRGDLLLVMGSPFGILSPVHFFNSVSAGAVANCCPFGSSDSAVLMADVRCLPGMEGAPVFSRHASLVGILTWPIRQRASGAEIQLVITWCAIVDAWRTHLQKDPLKTQVNLNHPPSALKFERALPSIVLVTVGESAWASGIILNKSGLILTNAHLLEPWRFSKTLSGGDEFKFPLSIPLENRIDYNEGKDKHTRFPIDLGYRGYKRIRVRLDHVEPPSWCNARAVYVSKGPLDVALLQLENVPVEVLPINTELGCPLPGSNVHVIGHGLFGPRADLRPSVSSGVVAKVVAIKRPVNHYELDSTTKGEFPVMLETTAAVHPGVSGGAVVDSDGHLVGLVTSNARHGGGTLIPHLNFSIPCASLQPIFKFSETLDESFLHVMDQPDKSLSAVWALMPPAPSGKQSQSDPGIPSSITEHKKEQKGSRFAKFLAEKQAETSFTDKKIGIHAQILPSKM
ncbi:hypothetical protein H6P81_019367 [Aristolochia fimbriata]|uniref:Glyoxysomal processing protease, glyoxysomal n=1 Tax=Aristolochia fimbriata TaxID=158543 RepID=A0AAV7DUN5_ARIFI|nr:hypothetical protein H6P81_019367 [Aristolochia fimbriata]